MFVFGRTLRSSARVSCPRLEALVLATSALRVVKMIAARSPHNFRVHCEVGSNVNDEIDAWRCGGRRGSKSDVECTYAPLLHSTSHHDDLLTKTTLRIAPCCGIGVRVLTACSEAHAHFLQGRLEM